MRTRNAVFIAITLTQCNYEINFETMCKMLLPNQVKRLKSTNFISSYVVFIFTFVFKMSSH